MDLAFQDALDTLRSLPGLDVKVKDAGEANVLVNVGSRSGECAYIAHAGQGVTTTTLPAVLARLERAGRESDSPAILLAPYLTPAVTEKLLAERVEFADGAGNVFLDGPAAYVLTLNNKPERRPESSAFNLTATGLELLYALLSRPALREATYRDLNAATGVSLGKISDTLRQLGAGGQLVRGRSGKIYFRDPAQLLERWEFGYLERLRPTLAPSGWRLGKNATLNDVIAAASEMTDVLVGGEVAADEFTRHLKPATLTLHVPRGRARATAARLRLPPADGDADVTVLERFVPAAGLEKTQPLDQFEGDGLRNLAHPILVRAELLVLNDSRLREVADRLLDAVILPELVTSNA